MKASRIITTLVLAIIVSSTYTLTVFSAQTTNTSTRDYTVLAPLPGTTDAGGKTTNIQTYIPGAFKFGIGIAALLAFVMITAGGIQYMTSDALSGKQEGRQKIENAIYGLLLAIGAYTILFTINPKMLEFELDIRQPENVNGPSTVVSIGIIDCNTVEKCFVLDANGVLLGYIMTPEMIAEDTAIRKELLGGGILGSFAVYVNNPNPCKNGKTIGCTNVFGLPTWAIQGLSALADDCGCILTITGGTEGGHKEHGPGKNVVDLAPSTKLNSLLAIVNPQANSPVCGTKVAVSIPGKPYVYTFRYESGADCGASTGDHWHLVIS